MATHPPYRDKDSIDDAADSIIIYGLHDGVPTAVAVDDDALVIIDSTHYMIHEGKAFSFSEVVTLGSGGTQDYLIIVGENKRPHFEYSIEGSFGVTLEMFEGTGKTQSAAAETVVNRNRDSSVTSETVLKKGTNGGSGDGTKIVWRKSGTGTAQGRLASSVVTRKERLLALETAYIFRITSAAASNDVSVEFDWYEE